MKTTIGEVCARTRSIDGGSMPSTIGSKAFLKGRGKSTVSFPPANSSIAKRSPAAPMASGGEKMTTFALVQVRDKQVGFEGSTESTERSANSEPPESKSLARKSASVRLGAKCLTTSENVALASARPFAGKTDSIEGLGTGASVTLTAAALSTPNGA
eukprot:1062772-Rhodomonas_salina.1